MSDHTNRRVPNRRTFVKGLGVGALAGVLGGVDGERAWVSRASRIAKGALSRSSASPPAATAYTLTSKRVSADPTRLPPPIGRRGPRRVEVTLQVREVVAEIEPGVAFAYLTFGGQVPGPMIRVRQGGHGPSYAFQFQSECERAQCGPACRLWDRARVPPRS